MKKLAICVLTLFVLMALAPLNASADTTTGFVPNTTQVLQYNGTKAAGSGANWFNNIPTGTASLFAISGYEIVFDSSSAANVTLKIYTNMPATGDVDIPGGVPVGDLFMNFGGNFNTAGFTTALDISTGTVVNITSASDYNTSQQLWYTRTGYYYGGEYRTSSGAGSSGPVPVEVLGTGGTTGPTAAWSNNPSSSGHPGTYILSILFPGLDGNTLNNGADLIFLWATGTCANGVIFGDYEYPVSPPGVPVPPSALLLGSGLLGLVLLGYRRKVR